MLIVNYYSANFAAVGSQSHPEPKTDLSCLEYQYAHHSQLCPQQPFDYQTAPIADWNATVNCSKVLWILQNLAHLIDSISFYELVFYSPYFGSVFIIQVIDRIATVDHLNWTWGTFAHAWQASGHQTTNLQSTGLS